MAGNVSMVESTPNSDYPRIALILNRYQAVINKGAKDGVRMGQSFLIYSIGPEVEDPVTKKNLGPIEYVKGRGRVIHVQDNVATIRSSEEKPVYSPTPPNPIS